VPIERVLVQRGEAAPMAVLFPQAQAQAQAPAWPREPTRELFLSVRTMALHGRGPRETDAGR
jgi:hypothetical protein